MRSRCQALAYRRAAPARSADRRRPAAQDVHQLGVAQQRGALFDFGFVPFGQELEVVIVVVVPLLVLGVPAAALAFGRHAAVGQAVGAVVLAAGGFLPIKVMVREFVSAGDADGYVHAVSMNPLTPSDWQLATFYGLGTGHASSVAGVVALTALALVLAASLARRPSAPLAAAVTLMLLAAVQFSLLTVLDVGSVDEAELFGWVLGAVGGAAALTALVTAAAASRRSDTEPAG